MDDLSNKYADCCLKRDLLRDFCLVAYSMEEQFSRFDSSGALSFAIILEVMGSEFNKGLLWHLKDTAHLSFKNKTLSRLSGQLDWAIGYLFHECLQVLEASYQLQHYGPKLASLCKLSPNDADPCPCVEEPLLLLAEQSSANLKHHITRARKLISTAKGLFCRYLAGDCANRPLARFIHDREKLLRDVFNDQLEELIQSIYGQERELVFLESALSLAELGQKHKAALALQKALDINPHNKKCSLLLDDMLAEPQER